jgi:hypothetical protein
MKRVLTFLFVVLAATGAKAALAQSSPACPANDSWVRGSVIARISDDRIRRDDGLGAVDTLHLRTLTDPSDTTVCQRFRSTTNYSPTWTDSTMTWSYYTADGFYFVAGRPTRVGSGYGILLIFDSAFNRKDAVLL